LPDKLDQGEPARVENTRVLGAWSGHRSKLKPKKMRKTN